jgi:membrane associated rhomboid family serine protease
MPMFLHLNVFHICSNVISLLFVGFIIEYNINNKLKYILLMFLGAIGGCLFSAVCDPYSLSVGFSTVNFALLAALCVFIYLKFHSLGALKYQLILIAALMIAFAFINGFLFHSSGGAKVDNYGHIGGFITGFCLSFFLLNGTDALETRRY